MMVNEARLEIGHQLMALVTTLEADQGLVEKWNSGDVSLLFHRTGASVVEYEPFAPGDLLEVPDPQAFEDGYWRGFAGELLRFLAVLSVSEHAKTWRAGEHWIKLEHHQFTVHATEDDAPVDDLPGQYL